MYSTVFLSSHPRCHELQVELDVVPLSVFLIHRRLVLKTSEEKLNASKLFGFSLLKWNTKLVSFLDIWEASFLVTYELACSAGVFIGHTNVLLTEVPCWNSKREEKMGRVTPTLRVYFLLYLIFLHHNIKDGGYNSTNITMQLLLTQNTPTLQATYEQPVTLCNKKICYNWLNWSILTLPITSQ